MTDDTPAAPETRAFRSPKRALARAFRLSRDRWKAKAQLRLAQLKGLSVEARDLRASRDRWKEEALRLRQQLRQDPPATEAAQAPPPSGEAPYPAPASAPAPTPAPAIDPEPVSPAEEAPPSKKAPTRRWS